MGQKFKRYISGGSIAQNLMTPVLVFMDNKGNCWDYTYHNIANDIFNLGRDKVLQQLKCLCLNHFDNNKLDGAQYVVDALSAFDRADYQGSQTNPWSAGTKQLSLSKDVVNADLGWNWKGNGINDKDSMLSYITDVLRSNGYDNGGPYFGSCIFSAVPWMQTTFPELEYCVTAADMNA